MAAVRRSLTALALAAAALTGAMLLPTQLGGSTSVVKASGRSMEPAIHAGDLVVLRREGDYQLGDVVAYQSRTLHEMVLHRVVEESGGSYTTRGDNNAWLDPDHPAHHEISGRQWLLIPHGGILLTWFSIPVILMVGAVAGVLSSGRRKADTVRGPNRGRPPVAVRRAARHKPRPWPQFSGALPDPTAPSFAVTCAVLALGAAWLGSTAFGLPLHVPAARPVAYQQTLTFDYQGRAQPGVAYPNGTLGWGDPVYTKLVNEVLVSVSHHVTGPQLGPTTGQLTLAVRMEGANGWQARLAPDVRVPLAAVGTKASIPIGLARIPDLEREVRAATGAELGGLTVVVEATATPRLTVAGQSATSTFRSTVSFRFDPAQLVLDAEEKTATSSNTVRVPRSQPAQMRLLGVAVPVWLARLASFALGLTALAGMVAMGFFLLHPRGVGFRIAHRYHGRLVEIQDVETELPVVDLATPQDLFRLADETGAVVLHYGKPRQSEGWLLEYGATRYRFIPHPRRPGSGQSTVRT